jgi:hypothetical protein
VLLVVLAWPLLFTLAILPLDRPHFTTGDFALLFVVLVIVVLCLVVSLI